MENNDKKPENIISNLLNSVAPLKLYEPMNFIVFISMYSPIILSLVMIIMSFATKSWKGLIFAGFLLSCSSLRSFLYFLFDKRPYLADPSKYVCDAVQYTRFGYDNNLFSQFVFAFTIAYISIPMFVNNQVNAYVFAGLLGYCLLDLFIRMGKKCISSYLELALNILGGAFLSGLIVTLMNAGGSGNYLFYNNSNDDGDDTGNGTKCSMASNQTFKCRVYKNGELISG